MKRIIALVLAICSLATLLTGCGIDALFKGKGNDNQLNSNKPSAMKEITFPSSLFEGEEDFDPDAYAEEQGFEKAVFNEDGTLTVTMTQAKYEELLSETSAEMEKNFAEMVDSEDTPYIKEITHNDDFSSVTVKVDRDAYESTFDFTPFAIGVTVSFYQTILEMDIHCEINMVDVDTGDVIKTTVYPDDLK